MAGQQKKRKPGRPKLPKATAKGKIVPIRFAADRFKAIEAAAKASNQSVSEWVRSLIDTILRSETVNWKVGH